MKLNNTLICCILLLCTVSSYAQSPVEFIENKGQWGEWFQYRAMTRGGDVCLEKDGFRYILADHTNNKRLDSFHHGLTKENPILKFHTYKVSFENSLTPRFTGSKPQKNYYNYYLGNDPTHWKSEIHPYYAVDYNQLYKDIDVHVSSEKGNMVYEMMVQPGANTDQIKLKFEGQESLKLKRGDLVIGTSVGDVTEMKPYAYQYLNDVRVQVACNYHLEQNEVTFDFPEDYDHTKLLVIDPTVVFSTLTGSTADNWGYTATYDNNGDFYAGGLVNALSLTVHFPVSPGAFQTTWGGGIGDGSATYGYAYAADISIIKYSPDGTSRLFATYLGGAGNEHAHSMIVDAGGNLILAGRTRSTNYPVTAGAYQTTNHGGWDMIVSKLNSTGTSLVASTYIGGSSNDCVNFDSTEYTYGELKHNYGDDSRSEVQVDAAGNIYVAGSTTSTDFPTTATAISSTLSGLQDGVVFKMNGSLSSLIWSTYITGNGSDAAYVLAFDTSQQHLFVAGGTNSSNLPTTAGCYQTAAQGGGADGFICRFVNSGTYALQKCTYVGTSGYDQIYGIQVDPTNNVYVMGQSIGGLFPVTGGVYSNPSSTQFVMKTDNNLTSDLISTVYGSGASTYTNISPVAFLVDTCQNVYVSGWGGNLGITGATTGTCTGMPVTPDAAQGTTDGMDFYFIVFAPGMTSLRYATFYGRSCATTWEGEHVDGGTSRFDKHGIIYQAICANCGGTASGCPGFPTTSGVWSMVDSSSNCNEAALKIAFNIGPVEAIITAGPSTSGCAPLAVNFSNTSNNALSFVWNFGDGSPTDTSYAPSHTYTAGGVYTVTLSAANSNACFVTNDTAHLTIVVDTNRIGPDFTYVVNDSCGPYDATFTNTSVYGSTPGAATFTVFHWLFGDGTSYTGTTPPIHSFSGTGTYTVTLVMIDSTACNSPDTVSKTITIQSGRVSGSFTIPDSICVGTSFTPVTNIVNALATNWTFGNGDTSITTNPTYLYNTPGTYTVTLIVSNPGSCNGADTFTASIKVIATPTANFSFIPVSPEANIPTTFTNLSTNATRYAWDFGDASTSAEKDPVHQFNRTGTYNVCLTAYNSASCPAKACKQVSADVVPIVGLPTGFSPNGDGENEILYVRGAAIATLDLKIFNRWGQLVFETTSQAVGWDGKFNGQPQPVDAYAYVLNVSFIDGTAKTLKGNITLLR